jgi:hypothetical protein
MGLADVRIYLPTLRGPLPSNNPLILSTHQNITPLALCGGVFLFSTLQKISKFSTSGYGSLYVPKHQKETQRESCRPVVL